MNRHTMYAPLSVGHDTFVTYPSMPENTTVSSNALSSNAPNGAIKLNVGGVSDFTSTGNLVLCMPMPNGRSPVSPPSLFEVMEPRPDTSAVPSSPVSSLVQISGPTISKTTTGSTPIKPPKKYRIPGDDCEIQRCKRSLSFAGSELQTAEEEKPPPRKKASVERRNKRERLRVKQINNTFVTLRNQLPNNCLSPKRNTKKFSKVDTLRNAIEYIRGLHQLIRDHDTMYTSALMSSPSAAKSGITVGDVETSSYRSYPIPCSTSVLDSASDRSGAESVDSSVTDPQSVYTHSLADFLMGLGNRSDADDLLDGFFLDVSNYT